MFNFYIQKPLLLGSHFFVLKKVHKKFNTLKKQKTNVNKNKNKNKKKIKENKGKLRIPDISDTEPLATISHPTN